MPHVIISGMPGIGKTTSILCLARQMLGDAYKEAVLELNASDERGAFLAPSRERTDGSRGNVRRERRVPDVAPAIEADHASDRYRRRA